MGGMGILNWLSSNWFSTIQSLGIIAGLIFSGISFRNLEAEERTSNLLAIKDQHDALWRTVFERPSLVRVLDPRPDLQESPVTPEEEFFVTMAIAHLNTSYRVLLQGETKPSDAVRQDVRWFFSLPIPKDVWGKIKGRQEPAFVQFVEICRSSE